MTIGGKRTTTTKVSPERQTARQSERQTRTPVRLIQSVTRKSVSPFSRAASSADTVRSPSPRERQFGGIKKGGNLAPLISALLLAAAATSLRIEEKRKRKDIRSSTSKTRSRTR